jgi:biotin operon repressor
MDKKATAQHILQLLQRQPMTARQLIDKLQISQPTLSRRIQQLGEQILQLGQARNAKYYAVRKTDKVINWPLYQVSAAGELALVGHLISLYPNYYCFRDAAADFVLYDDLPWFIQDIKPRGFIGRALAKQWWQRVGLCSPDPNDWHAEDVLTALTLIPHDSVGDLLIGEQSYYSWLSQAPGDISLQDLPQQAAQAEQGETTGSSAAGEQPKFLCSIEEEHYLVKFSAAANNAVSLRWADLLKAEALALKMLAELNIDAADTTIHQSDSRVFLLSKRFDRQGLFGRYGVVTLEAIDAEFIGRAGLPWPAIAKQMYSQALLTDSDVAKINLLWCFCLLIGNTDTHNGNLSFFYDAIFELKTPPRFRLTPAYDVLPMAFAPNRAGTMLQRGYIPQLRPEVEGGYWRQAYPVALQYWQQISSNNQFSTDFRRLANESRLQLMQLQQSINRML